MKEILCNFDISKKDFFFARENMTKLPSKVAHNRPKFNPRLFNHELFNPLVETFMFESFMVEEFMVEKSWMKSPGLKLGDEKSRVEMSCDPLKVTLTILKRNSKEFKARLRFKSLGKY